MDTKPWYMSKTIWVQVLFALADLAMVIQDEITKTEGMVIGIGIIITILLRFITKEAIRVGWKE